MRTRSKAAAIAAALIAAGIAAVPAVAGASATSHACQAPQPSPATRHVVTSGASLDQWAKHHGAYVGDILPETVACEGGGLTQVKFVNYLDAGNLHAPLPKGTVLFAFPYKK